MDPYVRCTTSRQRYTGCRRIVSLSGSAPAKADEDEAYALPEYRPESALFEHCVRPSTVHRLGSTGCDLAAATGKMHEPRPGGGHEGEAERCGGMVLYKVWMTSPVAVSHEANERCARYRLEAKR